MGLLQIVFSSSATVYGQPETVPCTEDYPLQVMNPYGRTKVTYPSQNLAIFCFVAACVRFFRDFCVLFN